MTEPGRTKNIPPASVPFECVALLLQGGGALGAYQAGVYEAMAEAGVYPTWVAGISIGAINSALIAGNPPELRVARLREFWESTTANSLGTLAGQYEAATQNFPWLGIMDQTAALAMGAQAQAAAQIAAQWPNYFTQSVSDYVARFAQQPVPTLLKDMETAMAKGDMARGALNHLSAASTLMNGAPGFFAPRFPGPWLQNGTVAATSYCDTAPLRATLERLVDFDLLNAGTVRLTVEAVNVRTGNFVYFDSAKEKIRPEHIMASGALPPAFPPVEIDGEFYWDGGTVSNTPLEQVVDSMPPLDTLAFQVDLWSARGNLPRNMPDVMTRQKEIQYSSRTRAATDRFRRAQKMRHAFAALYEQMPAELRETPEAKMLHAASDRKLYNIVHLIYRAKNYEGETKDYEFSRLSMHDHWMAGYHDTLRSLRHDDIFTRPDNAEGLAIYDFG